MPDRLESLEVFAKVASLGGFSAAARALGMSPGMAARHVDALEARLGVRLVLRSTRKLTLTEAGRRFLEGTERVLADLEALEAGTSADHEEVRGTLRLTVAHSFGVREIAPLMAEFMAAHPAISVELGLSDRYVDLADGTWDAAIRIGVLPDSSLTARKLAENRMVVCASPAYLAARGTPRSIADLSGHDCLCYTISRLFGADRWLFGTTGDIPVPVRGRLRADSGEALVAAAIAGHGIVYEPSFMVGEAVRSGALVVLHLDQPTITLGGVHAVWPSGRRPPAKVRALVEFLVRQFSPPRWEQGLGL